LANQLLRRFVDFFDEATLARIAGIEPTAARDLVEGRLKLERTAFREVAEKIAFSLVIVKMAEVRGNDPDLIRAWFAGCWPELGNRSVLQVLAQEKLTEAMKGRLVDLFFESSLL